MTARPLAIQHIQTTGKMAQHSPHHTARELRSNWNRLSALIQGGQDVERRQDRRNAYPNGIVRHVSTRANSPSEPERHVRIWGRGYREESVWVKDVRGGVYFGVVQDRPVKRISEL